MTARTTTTGYWRAHCDMNRKTTPAVVPVIYSVIGIDATLPGTDINTGLILPYNAVILACDIRGAGTGGTAPLIDVGLTFFSEPGGAPIQASDFVVDGAPADSNSSNRPIFNAPLGDEGFEVYITVSDGGGTNCTGGTIDLHLWCSFDDDRKRND